MYSFAWLSHTHLLRDIRERHRKALRASHSGCLSSVVTTQPGQDQQSNQSHHDGLESSQGSEVLEKKSTSSSSPKMVKSTYRSMPLDMEGSLQKIPCPDPQNLWLRRNHHSCDRAVSSHALKRDNYWVGLNQTHKPLKQRASSSGQSHGQRFKALWPV